MYLWKNTTVPWNLERTVYQELILSLQLITKTKTKCKSFITTKKEHYKELQAFGIPISES
jgi:hypothetical protein